MFYEFYEIQKSALGIIDTYYVWGLYKLGGKTLAKILNSMLIPTKRLYTSIDLSIF